MSNRKMSNKNEKPTLSAPPPSPPAATIEERLRQARENFEKSFREFHALLNDKTLKINKSQAEKNVEKYTVDKVIKSCITLDKLNVGEGIMAMVVVALREHLKARDRSNELEYELETLRTELKKLKKSLGE